MSSVHYTPRPRITLIFFSSPSSLSSPNIAIRSNPATFQSQITTTETSLHACPNKNQQQKELFF